MAEPFRHRLRVRWSECDLQGVVFYPNYLAYFDHLLTELWREAVGPYGEITQLGIDLVVAEASIRYRASARFDEEIEIVAAMSRLGTTSMTTGLKIERVADGALLAEGELRHVFVDPDNFKKRDIPDAVPAAEPLRRAGIIHLGSSPRRSPPTRSSSSSSARPRW